MKTFLIDKKEMDAVISVLEADGIVGIPTDTVYGLAVRSDKPELYQKLALVKGRPEDKPFPLMVGSLQQLIDLVEMDPLTLHLVNVFMPGAITFIFKKKDEVFPFLKTETLGIRMADDLWVQNLILKLKCPLWLPSANKSGFPTGTTSDNVLEQLNTEIEAVVVGESLNQKASTVVDLTGQKIRILREGPISLETIELEVKKYLENR